MTEHRFKPLWARFFVHRHEEFGITAMRVAGEGRVTDIGSFLNPDDRESFSKAFKGLCHRQAADLTCRRSLQESGGIDRLVVVKS